MYYSIGDKDKCLGAEKLQKITISRRPTAMPTMTHEGDKVICGYNRGFGEVLYVCETLEDMQELYDAYFAGGATSISWYIGNDPGIIIIISPGS